MVMRDMLASVPAAVPGGATIRPAGNARESISGSGQMKRREFVLSAGLLAGASALPLVARSHAASPASLWQLLWAPSAEAGSAWLPLHSACIRGCGEAALQVTMDAFHSAEPGNVVGQLGVHAIFDLPTGESARFLAWQFAGPGIGRSATAGTRFLAGRAAMRHFEIEYHLAGIRHVEQCDLVGAGHALLNPGHYLLAGPCAAGRPARIDHRHSGDVARPLAGATDFDYLAFRVGIAA
jgi:hypothetical protein